MRELTQEELVQVSGGFNPFVVIFSTTLSFAVGALAAIPFGPVGMLAAGTAAAGEALFYSTGEEVIRHGVNGLREMNDLPPVTF